MISGYLFKKIPTKPVSIRAFEPPWGKRKVPAFVSKAGAYYGAEGGIWFSSSPLVGPTGSKAALRPYSPPVGSNPFSSYFPCIAKETLISQSLFLGAEGGI